MFGKIFNYSFLLASLVVACGNPENKKESSVVAVNIHGLKREDLAALIGKLNKANPKVIAINAIFSELRSNLEDTLLRESIGTKGNVILVSNLSEGTVVRSNPFFLEMAKDDGMLVFGVDDDDVVNAYLPFVNLDERVFWSFPFAILSQYDIERAANLMDKIHPGSYYRISFRSTIEIITNSRTIQADELRSCENKIILLGDLEDLNDTFEIDSGEKLSSTVITAYILEGLLANELEREF
jgi:hypothetical protein